MQIPGISPSSGGGYKDLTPIYEMQGAVTSLQNQIEFAPMQSNLSPSQLLKQFNQFNNSLNDAMSLFSKYKSLLSPKDQASISDALQSVQGITVWGSNPTQEAQNFSQFISNFQDSQPTALYAMQSLQNVSTILSTYTS